MKTPEHQRAVILGLAIANKLEAAITMPIKHHPPCGAPRPSITDLYPEFADECLELIRKMRE